MSSSGSKGSDQMPDILDNFQIDEEFRNPTTRKPSVRYGGCYLSDDLARLTPERKVYVVNLDAAKNHSAGDTDIGSHWVGISNLLPTRIIYIDSFGLPPNESILRFLKKAKRPNGDPKEILYSTCALQDKDSEMCGWFSIYCLKQLLKKRSLLDILMTDFELIKTWRNDALVKKIHQRSYYDEWRD